MGWILIFMIACVKKQPSDHPILPEPALKVLTSEIINTDYIGNGAQWDAYPNAYVNWNTPLAEADWNKLFERLDFMRPKLMRVMIAAGWKYARNGDYDPTLHLEGLEKILQYCTDHDITVMFGDWGGGMVEISDLSINKENLTKAAKYVQFLIEEKRFTCIKYYNLINEPNGNWSITRGNYDLWQRAATFFHQKLDSLGLSRKLPLVGPDIAIWDTQSTHWIDNTVMDLQNKVGLYSIHTYPTQYEVQHRDYSALIKAYIERLPQGSGMVMGELGFKYTNRDQQLFEENKARILANDYASDDSNMFVFDFFYGLDMADAMMHAINAGFSGVVAWNLDDAMHNLDGGSGTDLKVWGFWNILGTELFGQPELEEIRPWFYSIALLSRYMPTNSIILKVETSLEYNLHAIAVEKDGRYMIALLNQDFQELNLFVQFDNKEVLSQGKRFLYSDSLRPTDASGFPIPVETDITFDFNEGYTVVLPPESFVVLTNFDY